MSKSQHRKHTHHKQRWQKRAAAIAGTLLMSAALLPGIAAPVAHASANPNSSPVTTQVTGSRIQPAGLPTINGVPVVARQGGQQAAPNIQFTQNVTIPSPANQPASNDQAVKPAQSNTDAQQQDTKPAAGTETKTQAPTQDDRSVQQDQADKHDQATQQDQSKKSQTNKEQNRSDSEQTKTSETRGQAPENYQDVLSITATAYAPGPHDNDQWGNKTYSGTQIRPGVIAVDPSVIPLGSRVYIQYPDGHGVYAVAEDTGGAIKGNRIDIAKWTVKEAEDFGIQHVKVFILDKAQNT